MPFQPTLYHSRIYRDFKAIEINEYKRIVRFYEKYEQKILGLEFEEYFEMLVRYANSLFQAGEYQKHLMMADSIIETSILQNIRVVEGEEIYRSTLFKKAASYYNLLEYGRAIHILQELVKMEPNNELNIRFLEKCFQNEHPNALRKSAAASIFLLLMAAAIVCIELVIVRNFYKPYVHIVEILRNTTFIFGCITLVGGRVYHYWSAHRKVTKFVAQARTSKKTAYYS